MCERDWGAIDVARDVKVVASHQMKINRNRTLPSGAYHKSTGFFSIYNTLFIGCRYHYSYSHNNLSLQQAHYAAIRLICCVYTYAEREQYIAVCHPLRYANCRRKSAEDKHFENLVLLCFFAALMFTRQKRNNWEAICARGNAASIPSVDYQPTGVDCLQWTKPGIDGG